MADKELPLYAQRLRQARNERGWVQHDLRSRLRAAAASRGFTLVSDDSLKRRISSWENGRGVPDERYQALLCAVFEVEPDDLGFNQEDAPDWGTPDPELIGLVARLDSSRAVDNELLELLKFQTNAIRLKDRRLGAATVADEMAAHIAQVDQLLKHAMLPQQRAGLAHVLADASALAGWQGVDTGTLHQSWEHFERAKAAAMMANDPSIQAFATAEQAYVLLDLGQADSALQLIEHAHGENRGKLPSLMRSWLHAAEAEAHAALGRELDSMRCMDLAAASLPADPDDPSLPYVALNLAHLARWRGSCLVQLGDSQVIDNLTDVLAGMNGFTRATAQLRCDLAEALIAQGRTEEAKGHLAEAQKLIMVAGSARQRRRYVRLSARV
ncbi:helix-turn-helix domain-containing protein [Yinghuangia sp. ASG 101]|uniref:helix-turn-helix domain-containing protein n=1 Tax=Yinghuangia sp. ASG 101 TaxID=2896848 RepID=UPI001E5B8777|nr:helix-turn-helix transcriptional regulator [Yinghuangia sp. ASG 101]UGQ14285.1 helix-turn-helix domain-containing protein [Yinghuangia sp. ASG 101]